MGITGLQARALMGLLPVACRVARTLLDANGLAMGNAMSGIKRMLGAPMGATNVLELCTVWLRDHRICDELVQQLHHAQSR